MVHDDILYIYILYIIHYFSCIEDPNNPRTGNHCRATRIRWKDRGFLNTAQLMVFHSWMRTVDQTNFMWVKECVFYYPGLGMAYTYHRHKNGDDLGSERRTSTKMLVMNGC